MMSAARASRLYSALQSSSSSSLKLNVPSWKSSSREYVRLSGTSKRCKCTCFYKHQQETVRGTGSETGSRHLTMSSRAFGSQSHGGYPFVDPDVGDIDDYDQPRPPRKSDGSRVKVKFNWKNSLVTTDSMKLLENLYQTHPQLVEFEENKLVYFFQRMSIYSIDVEKAAKMVIINPRLLQMSDDAIGSCINALRSIGLGETQRGHILRTKPEIFNIPTRKLTSQFAFLVTYFSKQEAGDVVCKSVEVLLEPESTLRPKLEYLIKDMSHETKNIVTCKALSYPLRHMKTRHEFLIRAGLFVPIPYRKVIKVMEKEYKDKNKPRNKYFKPIEVVCFKDEDFLKVCTKNLLTVNEYAAFEELYAAELDVLEEQEGEDEEEGDDAGIYEEADDNDAVSLVKAPNSVGFMNDVEAKGCYF